MRSKTFKTYLNVCLYKKRCGRYNILSRYFAGEKERISAKSKSVRYRKAAVRSCRDFQKGDLMYRHKTKKYRAAAVGAVLAAVLMLGFAGCDKLPTSSDSAATAAPDAYPGAGRPDRVCGRYHDGRHRHFRHEARGSRKGVQSSGVKAVCEHQRHGEKRRYRNDRKGQRADPLWIRWILR